MKKIDLINDAVEQLKDCQKCLDPESAHADADDILCNLLKNLGCKAVVDEYDKVDKWYA